MQRPWNKTPLPVYSLVTKSQEGVYNMNICTYVMPVSMKPKIYLIALDPKTKTYKNFINSERWVLQILSKNCKRYVKILWKTSGNNIDKLIKIQKYCTDYKWFPVLRESVVTLEIEKIRKLESPEWDHELFLVWVQSYTYLQPESSILTTDDIYSA